MFKKSLSSRDNHIGLTNVINRLNGFAEGDLGALENSIPNSGLVLVPSSFGILLQESFEQLNL